MALITTNQITWEWWKGRQWARHINRVRYVFGKLQNSVFIFLTSCRLFTGFAHILLPPTPHTIIAHFVHTSTSHTLLSISAHQHSICTDFEPAGMFSQGTGSSDGEDVSLLSSTDTAATGNCSSILLFHTIPALKPRRGSATRCPTCPTWGGGVWRA